MNIHEHHTLTPASPFQDIYNTSYIIMRNKFQGFHQSLLEIMSRYCLQINDDLKAWVFNTKTIIRTPKTWGYGQTNSLPLGFNIVLTRDLLTMIVNFTDLFISESMFNITLMGSELKCPLTYQCPNFLTAWIGALKKFTNY